MKYSSDKINETIQRIQKTYTDMEGISASTEEQTASMGEISSTAERFSVMAEELKNR